MAHKRTIVPWQQSYLRWIAVNGITGTVAAVAMVGIFAVVWPKTVGVPAPGFGLVLVLFPFWFGATLGLATGFGQSILLHKQASQRKRWLLRSCAGATMGVPLGLVVSVLLLAAWAKTFQVNTVAIGQTLLLPIWFSSIAAMTGVIQGLAQLAKPALLKGAVACRWVIANGVGYALGLFCGSHLALAIFSHLDFEADVRWVQGGLIHLLWNREVVIGSMGGLINGAVTGLSVSRFIQNSRRSRPD